METKPLFKTINAALSFEVGGQIINAVNSSSITIPTGEITIIFGPSGSGKSSLLNMISGLQPPSVGKLRYKDVELYDKTPNELALYRANDLGIVYQTNYWVKSLNVIENVALPLYFLGKSQAEAHKLALESLKRVDMGGYERKNPSLLSGGEQQRIAMARALVSNPPVIIADEPTGNLDSKNGDMIIDLLKKINKEQKITIILVTHNMEYLYMADHLIEIQDGNVTEIKQADIQDKVKTMLNDAQRRIESMMEKPR